MKKFVYTLFALSTLISCEAFKDEFGKLQDEWSPVWTPVPANPEAEHLWTESELADEKGLQQITPIAELKRMYKNVPTEILDNIWIKGQVISDDHTGNVYREMYIQDETGGIDLKIGRSSLYSEYRLGQWIYVYCNGLTVGAYSGMPQLGLEADKTSTNEYETSYIDVIPFINEHVFKGKFDAQVRPRTVSEEELKASLSAGFNGELWGEYVTLPGLTYSNQVFCLLYPNSNLPHSSAEPWNRIFLSDQTWGIDTWACSKTGFLDYLDSGKWDQAEVGSGASRYGAGSILKTPNELGVGSNFSTTEAAMTYKEIMKQHATASHVSHYFKLGGTDVQVRTSGYAKFSDEKLSETVPSSGTVSITGIITTYNGAAQLTLIDVPANCVKK